jgi:hypothetical protein
MAKQQVIIKRYKYDKEYQRDAQRMAKAGYIVQSVTSEQPRAGCGRWLTLGIFALMFKPTPELVVTYVLAQPVMAR